jgi:hypothetical protein
MKRLSTLSSTSSRDPNSRPDTPSISNGSMAFSHDGSTAPIIGHSSPSPLPPNKLVKRSSSTRVGQQTSHTLPPSRGHTFRRPATSHQRSATLQNQPPLIETSLEASIPPLPASVPARAAEDIQYTHFFIAGKAREKQGAKKWGVAGESKSFKRLLPDSRHQPTLILAKSVTACAVEFNEYSDDESFMTNSRPATPDLDEMLPPEDQRKQDGLNPVESSSEPRPRRSFSITDLIASKQQSWKQRGAKPESSKLKRKNSRRISSAPSSMPPNKAGIETVTSPTGPGIKAQQPARMTPLASPKSRVPSSSDLQPAMPSERPSSQSPSGSTLRRDASSSSIQAMAKKHQRTQSNSIQIAGRPPRYSLVSEHGSTLVGSDNDTRGVGSGDDEDTDLQSDTVFDSIRTRATRSTSLSRGPPIETIFDESPPAKDRAPIFFKGLSRGSDGAGESRITEEDEHAPSPARTTDTVRDISPSSHRANGTAIFTTVAASTADMPKALNLGTLEWDTVPAEDDDKWSFSSDEDENPWKVSDRRGLGASSVTPGNTNRLSLGARSRASLSTPRNAQTDHADRDARSSIFDWSEQPRPDKSPGNGTPPRPRTVHGKKDADVRGSRSMGRRAPSALHARSQSVPVVPDATGKREPVVTNKFGTWGVGSKGVTEDWDDDFDFSPPNDPSLPNDEESTTRIDSGFSMLVPKTIQEQQTKVLANIGLLREWGLLIEELKELRIRAATLDLLDGPLTQIWEEVDAMIDLADQEVDDPLVPNHSEPSSPEFDFDGFDEKSPTAAGVGRSYRKTSLGKPNGGSHTASRSAPHSGRSRRRSMRTVSNTLRDASPTPRSTRPTQSPSQAPTPSGRPRKDSEAVARSVIEALQKRKSTSEPVEYTEQAESGTSGNKVPFDTGTLRHIVPYVHGLMRKVKDVMREAEGLNISPYQSLRQTLRPLQPPHPPLSDLFRDTNEIKELNESPPHKEIRLKGNNPYPVKESDLATQMKFMTVM